MQRLRGSLNCGANVPNSISRSNTVSISCCFIGIAHDDFARGLDPVGLVLRPQDTFVAVVLPIVAFRVRSAAHFILSREDFDFLTDSIHRVVLGFSLEGAFVGVRRTFVSVGRASFPQDDLV